MKIKRWTVYDGLIHHKYHSKRFVTRRGANELRQAMIDQLSINYSLTASDREKIKVVELN